MKKTEKDPLLCSTCQAAPPMYDPVRVYMKCESCYYASLERRRANRDAKLKRIAESIKAAGKEKTTETTI